MRIKPEGWTEPRVWSDTGATNRTDPGVSKYHSGFILNDPAYRKSFNYMHYLHTKWERYFDGLHQEKQSFNLTEGPETVGSGTVPCNMFIIDDEVRITILTNTFYNMIKNGNGPEFTFTGIPDKAFFYTNWTDEETGVVLTNGFDNWVPILWSLEGTNTERIVGHASFKYISPGNTELRVFYVDHATGAQANMLNNDTIQVYQQTLIFNRRPVVHI